MLSFLKCVGQTDLLAASSKFAEKQLPPMPKRIQRLQRHDNKAHWKLCNINGTESFKVMHGRKLLSKNHGHYCKFVYALLLWLFLPILWTLRVFQTILGIYKSGKSEKLGVLGEFHPVKRIGEHSGNSEKKTGILKSEGEKISAVFATKMSQSGSGFNVLVYT